MKNNRHSHARGAGRRGRRPRDREQILLDYRSSRLSQREFALQRKVGLSTLQLWLRQERDDAQRTQEASLSGQPGSFLEVALPLPGFSPALHHSSSQWHYEIQLPDQTRLRLPGGFCDREAGQLLALLRAGAKSIAAA